MSQPSLTPQQFEKDCLQAKAEGFEVIQAEPDLLLLDLDTPSQVDTYSRAFSILKEHLDIQEVSRWASKSGNTHVIVKLPFGLPTIDRLALEIALGSDPIRGLLNIINFYHGVLEPSVLFKPPSKQPIGDIAPHLSEDVKDMWDLEN